MRLQQVPNLVFYGIVHRAPIFENLLLLARMIAMTGLYWCGNCLIYFS